MKVYKSINEFLANKPGVAPSKPGISPGVKPGEPGTKPKYPSPIRRDKPSVKPDTKAEIEVLTVRSTEEDLVERFIDELRSQDREIEIAFSAIKKRYSK
jgi:hypothetical protein